MAGTDDWFGYFEESMRRADRSNDERDQMHKRLLAEPCMKEAEVGDRVLVPAGMLGRGYMWKRLECVVIEKADTSYRIQGTDGYGNKPWEEWIPRELVTDVLKGNPASEVTPTKGSP